MRLLRSSPYRRLRVPFGAVCAAATIAVATAASAAAAPPDTEPPASGPTAGEAAPCSAPADEPSSATDGSVVPDSVVPSSADVTAGSVPADAGTPVGIWCVESVGAQPVGAVVATVEFTTDGNVQGNGGVNTFSGSYQVVDGQIEFGPVMSTLIAGPEDAMEVEQGLFAVLAGSQPFTIDGDLLTLGSGENSAVLRQVSPSSGELVVVSGTVTYRERMALPPDAVLVVRVDDVTAGDGSAPLAEASITVTNQVPIAYAVALDRDSLHLGGRYALSAEIIVADAVLFASTGEHPVYAEPASQTINVVVSRV